MVCIRDKLLFHAISAVRDIVLGQTVLLFSKDFSELFASLHLEWFRYRWLFSLISQEMGQHSLVNVSHSLKILCSGSNEAFIATKYDNENEMLASQPLQSTEVDCMI